MFCKVLHYFILAKPDLITGLVYKILLDRKCQESKLFMHAGCHKLSAPLRKIAALNKLTDINDGWTVF